MSTIFMKDVKATVEGTDYSTQLSSVALTPSAATASWSGFNGATQQNTAAATWQADIAFGQDWSATGFSKYLFDNEGKQVTMTFAPTKTGGPTFTAKVTLIPGTVGGAVNAYAESTVSLPIDGKPTAAAAA